MSVVRTLRDAAAVVPDGALVTFGGFQLNRAPMALLRELVRQGRRGLRAVTLPNPLALDLLVGAGVVEEATFGFCGFEYEAGFVTAPNVRRAVEARAIRWVERDVYEIVQGLRAAAMGLSSLPAPGGEGSDYRGVNGTPAQVDPVSGEEVLVAEAIRPDVALLHAPVADRVGNLRIDDRYADDLLACASRRVVATAERIVDRLESPTVGAHLVEVVAEAPGGALPTSCRGHYGYGATELREYVTRAAEGRFGEYLAARLTGPADRVVVAMARAIGDGDRVATGVASALPMLAVALARRTHAPRLLYINCVGAVDPEIAGAAASSVDPRLLDHCRSTLGLPELFDLARRGGIDLMFFGAAQVDERARINLTCIGEYRRPRTKLAGPAGSPSMRSHVRKVVIVVPRHSTRSLVRAVDFATAVPAPRNRETMVVTDRARLRLDSGRLRLVSRHAGVAVEDLRARTAFPLEGDWDATTPEPTPGEMAALAALDPGGIRHRLIRREAR